MTKTYQHKFKDGRMIRLTVDFNGDNLNMSCDPFKHTVESRTEYQLWRNTIVMPDVMNHASPKQIANAVAGLAVD